MTAINNTRRPKNSAILIIEVGRIHDIVSGPWHTLYDVFNSVFDTHILGLFVVGSLQTRNRLRKLVVQS